MVNEWKYIYTYIYTLDFLLEVQLFDYVENALQTSLESTEVTQDIYSKGPKKLLIKNNL